VPSPAAAIWWQVVQPTPSRASCPAAPGSLVTVKSIAARRQLARAHRRVAARAQIVDHRHAAGVSGALAAPHREPVRVARRPVHHRRRVGRDRRDVTPGTVTDDAAGGAVARRAALAGREVRAVHRGGRRQRRQPAGRHVDGRVGVAPRPTARGGEHDRRDQQRSEQLGTHANRRRPWSWRRQGAPTRRVVTRTACATIVLPCALQAVSARGA
jgi:hypothetical protein